MLNIQCLLDMNNDFHLSEQKEGEDARIVADISYLFLSFVLACFLFSFFCYVLTNENALSSFN